MNRQKTAKKIEILFEQVIWNVRFFVVVPVIFSLLSCLNFFVMGTLEICQGFNLHFNPSEPESVTAYQIVVYIIGGIDYYLIGIVLLIFGLGIYELFISKIDSKEQTEAIGLFENSSLEELKGKLVKVIVVALVISFFKKILTFQIEQATDLLYIGFSIFLIAVTNYLLKISPDSLSSNPSKAQILIPQNKKNEEKF